MKRILLAFGLMIPMLITAQTGNTDTISKKENSFQMGIKANAGISFIKNGFIESASNKPAFAYNGGIFLKYRLSDKSSLEIDILFTQMNGHNSFIIPFTDVTGNEIGYGDADLYYHFSYLSLPIEYCYKISKLSINIGIQISYLFASSYEYVFSGTINGTNYSHDVINKDLDIIKTDIGPKLGLFYDVSNKFFIDVDYFYGITNHIKSSPADWALKDQQLTFGIGYRLY